MENQKTTTKIGLEYGIFFGSAMVLVFVIIYAMGIDLFENPMIGTTSSLLSYIVFPVTFISLAIVAYKKANQGYLSIGESIKTGVTVAFIAAAIMALFNVVFNMIFPEYMDEILSQTRKIMMKQNPSMTSAQINQALEMTKKFSSPIFSVPLTILIFTFVGLIYSLIIGAINKKDKAFFN